MGIGVYNNGAAARIYPGRSVKCLRYINRAAQGIISHNAFRIVDPGIPGPRLFFLGQVLSGVKVMPGYILIPGLVFPNAAVIGLNGHTGIRIRSRPEPVNKFLRRHPAVIQPPVTGILCGKTGCIISNRFATGIFPVYQIFLLGYYFNGLVRCVVGILGPVSIIFIPDIT